jgi:hypothetical protein
MNIMTELNALDIAADFINTTAKHIFLTGKAGTGKTTFLKSLGERTHKPFLIVAPTGIAALNAGGVTIHSQFQLPLGSFIPQRPLSPTMTPTGNFYTAENLARRHPMSSLRRQVLRSIELLIIDEVSMLRADLLDAIDSRLRSVKGNHHKSFGGVQVLMIGDLFQLPPIVKDHEWNQLKEFYSSAYFFESIALKRDGFVQIELDKIFRQSDHRFISLLNNLRENRISREDIDALNSYYKPKQEIEQLKGIITITTHNNKADEINRFELNRLSSKSFFYEALIDGEFPESIYPLNASLELRVGAQVMFIKNDTGQDARYYNGKLAEVVELEEDGIVVKMDDQNDTYKIKRYEWENKRYTVNERNREIEEEVTGTFAQYPIKLAWAVTVHKSQGLTFDAAIIDVETAFASGQVYVALSRLRSLDGLVLRSHIQPSAISNDQTVVNFSASKLPSEQLVQVLEEQQMQYVQELLSGCFDLSPLLKELKYKFDSGPEQETLGDSEMQDPMQAIRRALLENEKYTLPFTRQLLSHLSQQNLNALLERYHSGAKYFGELLENQEKVLVKHIEHVKQVDRKKGYLNDLEEFLQLMHNKLRDLMKTSVIIEGVLKKQPIVLPVDFTALINTEKWIEEAKQLIASDPALLKSVVKRSGKKKASTKKEDTVSVTLGLFKQNKSVQHIAEQRELAVGTIEGHLATAIEQGRIDYKEWLTDEEIDIIAKAWLDAPESGNKYIYDLLGQQYSYGKIKAVRLLKLSKQD